MSAARLSSVTEAGSSRDRRSTVVVTGIGLVTALGNGREATWSALRAGRSGARRVALEHGVVGVGYPSVGRDPAAGSLGLLRIALADAMTDAAWTTSSHDPDRVGTLIGSSKPSVGHAPPRARTSDPDGGPDWWPFWPHHGSTTVARLGGFGGPCAGPVAACATGLVAVLRAADLIQSGACDAAFAGAADASLEPLWMAAFQRMGVLARPRPDEDPLRSLRPWDRARSGFLVGEGAAILVLERAEDARARGVAPHAVLAGGAFGSDGHHVTNVNPDPTGLARLIGRALEDAELDPADIDHANVHGTATRENDPLECRALRRAFGSHADSISCSANKAQLGHCLGAAGAVELAITCLAIRDGFVPPTLHLTDPDPACDLDGTPGVGKERRIGAALKLSLGFGGHLAVAVLRAPDGPRREHGDG